MFILLPTTIISLLLTSSAYAFQIEDRKCYTDLCLQSFKWCEPGHGDIDDCDFLENVYLLSPYAGGGPALVWNQSYEIKWTRKDADTPVTIRWAFMRLFEGQVRSRVGADWEYNVTDGSTSFIFTPSRSMFPNERAPNMSFEEAHGLVKQQSYLHIHQFSDRNNLSSSKLAQDESDMFTLIDGSDVKYIKHAKDGVRKEWKHKLKLGLGIGIPLTFAVAWVLAFACGWLWSKQRAAKDGGQGVLQGDRVVDSKKGSRERELEST